jgi:hypothetical protein
VGQLENPKSVNSFNIAPSFWHGRIMLKRSRMPRDPNQLAKIIVDMATGKGPPEPEQLARNPAAVALGKLGGPKGGKARAKALSPARRKAIAKKAAAKRWGTKD